MSQNLIVVEKKTHAALAALAKQRQQPIKVVASAIIDAYFKRRAYNAAISAKHVVKVVKGKRSEK